MSSLLSPTPLPVGIWSADPAHSRIGFALRHMALSTFRGSFSDYDAVLTVDRFGAGVLVVSVSAESVSVPHDALTRRLRSPAFLDAEEFPLLSFQSTLIRRDRDHLELDGTLSIRGRTLAVAVSGRLAGPEDDLRGATRLGLQLETVIDRRQFGLDWNRELPQGGLALGHEVTAQLDLELVRERSHDQRRSGPLG